MAKATDFRLCTRSGHEKY